MKPLELTGAIFGKLTALRPVQKDGVRLWLCKCTCGTSVPIAAGSLNAGQRTSCGRCPDQLVGKTFGLLTVLRRAPTMSSWSSESRSQPHTRYHCVCKCGTPRVVDGTKLVNGSTRSCGCIRKGTAYRSRLPPGEALRNSVISSYRSNARRKNLPYQLSDARASKLLTSTCFYCGAPPSRPAIRAGMRGQFLYNGIDRLDNRRGYTVKNSVPCCTLCNYKKGNQSADEFLTWVRKVATHSAGSGR